MNGYKLNRRDFLRMSALTTASVALAACAPTATQQPAAEATAAPAGATAAPVEPTAAPPEAEAVTLRWLDWSDQDDINNAAIATFTAEHPNVTINFEPIGDGWGDKQLAQMVAGTAPDILTGNDGTSYMWAEKGQLLDMNPLVDVDLTQAQIDDFFPYQWNGLLNPFNGIRMGIPYYPWFYQWYYNQDAFADAGLDNPGEDWALDDYGAALEALVVKDGDKITRWGGIEVCYDDFRLQIWLGTFGGTMVDPDDPTHCTLGSDECLDALEWHRARLWDDNTLAQALQVENSQSLDLIATGKVAVMGQGSGDMGTLLANPPDFSWGSALPPIGPLGKRSGLGTIDNWGIWSGTSSPDMAWEFVKLLSLEDTFSLAFSGMWGVMVNRISLLPKFKQNLMDTYPGAVREDQIDIQIEMVTGDYTRIGQQFKHHKESRDLINPLIQKLFVVGDSPVSDAIEVADQVTALNREES